MDNRFLTLIDTLNNNPYHLFSEKDVEALEKEWFQSMKLETVICEECDDRGQIDDANGKYFSVCDNGHVTYLEEAQVNKYKFKINYLQAEAVKKFNLIATEDIDTLNPAIRKIGTFGDISVYFSLPKALETGVFNFVTSKLKSEVARIVLTKKELLPVLFIENLKAFGIFVVDIFEEDNLNTLLEEQEETISLFTKLESMSVDVKISNLELTATTASGDAFEDETYKIISKVFNLCIPFGNQYKGFAIPDGMISDGSRSESCVIFYDCKSFNTKDFKHKSEIPMQVNYYQSFLSDFFSHDEYTNKGFIIFSNSFSSEEVREKIIGSAQWKYVFEQTDIYYMGVKELEHLKFLYETFYDGSYYDDKVVFSLLFGRDISQISNNEVKASYQKIFSPTYEKYHFIEKNEVEFAFIYGLIKGYLKKDRNYLTLSHDLTRVISSAKHDNLKKDINKPQFFDMYGKLMEAVKRKELGELEHLSPLSIFAMMKEIEISQSNAGISELSSNWSTLLGKVKEQVEEQFL
ncbi:hypothetical protein [Priestia megaterium]|uniref:hypothetical protein n=1 Tax=Priestia megaterium TaxID=1404 RepID=UPI0022205A55|nr:hypothetical protein [Priestia megaterium]UYV52559.1 hypothetical protein OHU65_23730 [Priestia megaterium]